MVEYDAVCCFYLSPMNIDKYGICVFLHSYNMGICFYLPLNTISLRYYNMSKWCGHGGHIYAAAMQHVF